MSLLNNYLAANRGPTSQHYRSEDGEHLFTFHFIPERDHITIYCLKRPPLDGRDPSALKTHLFASGKICFVAGREPRDLANAQRLAKQWAEYFLKYRRTGVAQM